MFMGLPKSACCCETTQTPAPRTAASTTHKARPPSPTHTLRPHAISHQWCARITRSHSITPTALRLLRSAHHFVEAPGTLRSLRWLPSKTRLRPDEASDLRPPAFTPASPSASLSLRLEDSHACVPFPFSRSRSLCTTTPGGLRPLSTPLLPQTACHSLRRLPHRHPHGCLGGPSPQRSSPRVHSVAMLLCPDLGEPLRSVEDSLPPGYMTPSKIGHRRPLRTATLPAASSHRTSARYARSTATQPGASCRCGLPASALFTCLWLFLAVPYARCARSGPIPCIAVKGTGVTTCRMRSLRSLHSMTRVIRQPDHPCRFAALPLASLGDSSARRLAPPACGCNPWRALPVSCRLRFTRSGHT